MNKLKTLQKKIRSLSYCTYDWGTYYTWQERNKLLDRMEKAEIPVEWLDAKRLPPSKIHRLREFCKKHYPGVSW